MKLLKKLFIIICLTLSSNILFSQTSSVTNHVNMIFPSPFATAIDDLGWNIGNNDGYGTLNGPYRIGLNRKMGLKDYQCLVAIADTLNIRLQGLFILAEFDKENILKNYPTTTWMGKDWNNIYLNSEEADKIMEYVKNHAAYLEFGLHGVGHEYWLDNGERRRAEWYNIDENKPWPKEQISKHIEAFKTIMAQYGIDKKNGHSFPESFVPCAYGYHWNPNGDYSTGSMLQPEGVKYANTLFAEVEELNPPKEANGGGIDHGILVLNRINYGNPWYELASLPTVPVEKQESNIIETHWTNWLAQDDFLQANVNQQWIEYFRNIQKVPDRYIAKNTEQFYSQWLYKKYTKIEESKEGNVRIDNSQMPKEVYDAGLLSTLVLKIPLKNDEHLNDAELNGKPIFSYYEEAGFGFIDLPPLKAKTYELNYRLGDDFLPTYILHNGSYIIYEAHQRKNEFEFKTRMYGSQMIQIMGLDEPKEVLSDNNNLQIISTEYLAEKKQVNLILKAHDLQGETGIIKLKF